MTTIIEDPVTQEGAFRVQDSPGRRVLARLHKMWKNGEIRWIRGQRKDGNNGFCMLGGIEHVAHILANEEGLDQGAADREAKSLVSEVISGKFTRRGIASANDGYFGRIGKGRTTLLYDPLSVIEDAVRLEATP